jgi:fructokinase
VKGNEESLSKSSYKKRGFPSLPFSALHGESPLKLLGVDLGGTKIEAAVLDEKGAVVWRERVATPRQNYEGTIAAITKLVGSAEAAVGPVSVGLGVPGALSPATNVIKNANSTALNGRPFQQDLERSLGRAVRLANDANCLAVSEATDGAAAGARIVFAVILGTGTGGGIVVDGKLLVGANAIGGEWGHNSLPWPNAEEVPGPRCYCGRHGCIETFLSGPGLAAAYARSSGTRGVTSEEVVTRAAAGESAAGECLSVWEDRLARGLASVINLIDPDVIVVGGGLSQISRLYVNVPERWSRYVFSDVTVTRLVPAAHGDASGVRGAAWLWRG